MNKLIIGLLVVAAGTGAFFLLRKKKGQTEKAELKKEWIIGTWKTDAVMTNDSNFNKYRFNFQEDGNVVRSLNDSAKADTSHYEWNKANELVWKEKATDSTGKLYAVLSLTQDSLQVRSADSVQLLFTRVK